MPRTFENHDWAFKRTEGRNSDTRRKQPVDLPLWMVEEVMEWAKVTHKSILQSESPRAVSEPETDHSF